MSPLIPDLTSKKGNLENMRGMPGVILVRPNRSKDRKQYDKLFWADQLKGDLCKKALGAPPDGFRWDIDPKTELCIKVPISQGKSAPQGCQPEGTELGTDPKGNKIVADGKCGIIHIGKNGKPVKWKDGHSVEPEPKKSKNDCKKSP